MEIWSIVYERPEASFTGFGRVAWCLSKAFFKRKIHANIIYLIPEKGSAIKKETIDGVTLYGIPATGNFMRKRISFYTQTLYLIKRTINQNDQNIFFLHGAFSLPLSQPLSKLHSKVVYHTFGTLMREFKVSIPGILRTLDIKKLILYATDLPIETIYLKNTNVIIVPHQVAATEFQRIYNIRRNKIAISPYGQDIFERYHDDQFCKEVRRFKKGFKSKKIVLFVGGTAWNRKGAEYVLHSFCKLSKTMPVTLIMTGKPMPQYLSLAKQLGLRIGEDIMLPGLVDDKTLALFYAACDVFFLPSRHEGFSQPVLEVMAFGKPVVASPLAAYPTVEDGIEGFVVNPKSEGSYADRLQEILTNKELYSSMSKKAALKALKYSWNQIGYDLSNYLNRLISPQMNENLNKSEIKNSQGDSKIHVERMRHVDFHKINKMYDNLSSTTKSVFHPGFIGYHKLNIRWFFYQCALVLSTWRIYRGFLESIFPQLVFFSFVAFNSKNEVVGFAFINLDSKLQHGGYKGNVGIAVVEKYQGIGVGTKLITQVIFNAAIEGIKQIDLMVATSNRKAINLYKKHGFLFTKPANDYWTIMKIDCIEMTLYLKDKVRGCGGCD